MTLWPSSLLLLPKPPGHMSVAEFISTQAELSADGTNKNDL